MILTELSTAIPERLPAQLNFADLGSQFQAVHSKQSVHIQPSSGNTFSPDGIRVIRFNVTGEGYLVPEYLRLQALFTVMKGTAGEAESFKKSSNMVSAVGASLESGSKVPKISLFEFNVSAGLCIVLFH